MEEGAPSTAQLVLQGKCVAKFNGLRPNAADPVTGGDVTTANVQQQAANLHQQLRNLQRQRAKLHHQLPLGDLPLRRQPANLHHQSATSCLWVIGPCVASLQTCITRAPSSLFPTPPPSARSPLTPPRTPPLFLFPLSLSIY